jgi:ketosteroid isomerase-like protein
VIIDAVLVFAALSAAEADLRQQVICAETGFSRAAEARDPAAFIRFVDPDARFIGASVARGRDAVAQAWAGLLDPDGPSIRWRPAYVEVTADGKLALSRGPYRVISADENGATRETWGHFNSTWRRDEDGEWQVVFDAGGDAGMTPTAEEIEILEAEPDCP